MSGFTEVIVVGSSVVDRLVAYERYLPFYTVGVFYRVGNWLLRSYPLGTALADGHVAEHDGHESRWPRWDSQPAPGCEGDRRLPTALGCRAEDTARQGHQ